MKTNIEHLCKLITQNCPHCKKLRSAPVRLGSGASRAGTTSCCSQDREQDSFLDSGLTKVKCFLETNPAIFKAPRIKCHTMRYRKLSVTWKKSCSRLCSQWPKAKLKGGDRQQIRPPGYRADGRCSWWATAQQNSEGRSGKKKKGNTESPDWEVKHQGQ